jgi:hypothetical protein
MRTRWAPTLALAAVLSLGALAGCEARGEVDPGDDGAGVEVDVGDEDQGGKY